VRRGEGKKRGEAGAKTKGRRKEVRRWEGRDEMGG